MGGRAGIGARGERTVKDVRDVVLPLAAYCLLLCSCSVQGNGSGVLRLTAYRLQLTALLVQRAAVLHSVSPLGAAGAA